MEPGRQSYEEIDVEETCPLLTSTSTRARAFGCPYVIDIPLVIHHVSESRPADCLFVFCPSPWYDLPYTVPYQLQSPELPLPILSTSLVDLLFTPLLIARAATVSFFNPFRRATVEQDAGQIQVGVKWGRERFNIPIPKPAITPLSQLLSTLSTQTHLPLDQLKLVYKGAVLKDPVLTISSYGIKDGSTLVLIGQGGDVPSSSSASIPGGSSSANPGAASAPKKKRQPETSTESVLVDYIRGLVNGLLDPLRPSLATFTSQADPRSTNKPAHIPKFDMLQKEHARLSEMLLRGLLDLDGVEIPSGWADARKERKEGVRAVQQELTRVDEVWGERKKLGA